MASQCTYYATEDGKRCVSSNTKLIGSLQRALCDQHLQAESTTAYLEASDHLKQDVHEFWQRSSFFILVEGGLMSVFGLTLDQSEITFQSSLAGFGILTALVWLWVVAWSVIWISRWLRLVVAIEEKVPLFQLHTLARTGIQAGSSVQGIVAVLPLFIAFGWGTMLTDEHTLMALPVTSWGWLTLLVAFVSFLLMYSQSDAKFEEKLQKSAWGQSDTVDRETPDQADRQTPA